MNNGEPKQSDLTTPEQSVVPGSEQPQLKATPRLSRKQFLGLGGAAVLALGLGTWATWPKDEPANTQQATAPAIQLNLGDRTLTPATAQSLAEATAKPAQGKPTVAAAAPTRSANQASSAPTAQAEASTQTPKAAEATPVTSVKQEIKIEIDPSDEDGALYVVGGDMMLAPEDGPGLKTTISYDKLPDGSNPPAVEFNSTRFDSIDIDPSDPDINATYLSYANNAEDQYLVQEVHSFYPVLANGKADMQHPEGGELDRKFYQVDWMNVDGRLHSTLTTKEMDERIAMAKGTTGTIKQENGVEHPITVVGKWYIDAEGVGRMEKAFLDASRAEKAGQTVDYGTLDHLNFVKNYDGPSAKDIAKEKGRYIVRVTCALQASDEKTVDLKQYGVSDPIGLKARRIVEVIRVEK